MTAIALDLARQQLLTPTGVEFHDLEKVLADLCARQVDLADVYLEFTRSEAWSLEDGIVKEGVHSIRQGAGVRAVSGEQTGFAYSDDLTVSALLEAARTARAITRQGQARDVRITTREQAPSLYAAVDPLLEIDAADKLALMRSLDARLRAANDCVREVMVSLSGQYSAVMVATSDGTLAADLRPLVRLNVTVIVERDGRREEGHRDGRLVEDAEEPPDAGAAAVLVHRLDGEVALPLQCERQLVEDVVGVVAHREGLLGALLVVDDDL